MCIPTYRNNTHQAKLANCGSPVIWVGYADGHPTGTYQIFSSKAKKIILTREVTFLQKSYKDYSKDEKPVLVMISYEGLDDEEELEMVLLVNQNNNYYNAVSDSDSDSDDKNE